MLEANPNLGYRDVQEILSLTATSENVLAVIGNGMVIVHGIMVVAMLVMTSVMG
ncbi:hypothetical protein INT80_11455 [Gallibacterium anatis]|uniref:Uncharacterized protein n=1 Tax=Gallibacterium anatis TaxID=750 RepID=A0A930UX92_9PAST|nr:hypothetical protein [Gallibacterium anatis]